MHCGLFGKLPSKRDFVSYGMGRPFLDLWEKWLQTAVAVSRDKMGEHWQNAFLSAPLWRFWLGSRVAGTTISGVLMPSVDKVGRYFPLSICAVAPTGQRIDPPPCTSLNHWHQECERLLLYLLEDELSDDPLKLVEKLPFPETQPHMTLPAGFFSKPVHTATDGNLDALLQGLAGESHDVVHSGRSYWWTHGGRDHPPQICVIGGMPSPSVFSGMLTGEFTGALSQ